MANLFGWFLAPFAALAWVLTKSTTKRPFIESMKASCFNKHECDFTAQPVVILHGGKFRKCKNELCNTVSAQDDDGNWLEPL